MAETGGDSPRDRESPRAGSVAASAASAAASAAAGAANWATGGCPLFAMQVAVSTACLAFGLAMLAVGRDPAVYLPIVTSVVWYWLPAPRRPAPRVATDAP